MRLLRMCNTFPLRELVLSDAAMYRSFSPTPVRPNPPLRKPSSSPVVFGVSPPRGKPVPAGLPVQPATGAAVDAPISSPVSRDPPNNGSVQPALTVYFCNYCGQQGSFRCKRCKKTSYCSVVCQTEDWKAHRHVCKFIDPELAKETPKKATALPVAVEKTGVPESKHDDKSSLRRVYMKDLQMTEVIKGTDIQATVVEFYSPGKFFLVVQSPEVLEALKSITRALQKTYNLLSVMTYVPCAGEVCAVQFSYDMNWYRGLVKTLATDQKKANILYIDFGNEEDVPVDRIRPLAADIQPFHPCAMECRIAGVLPVTGNWSGECCISLRQRLAGKTVTVKPVETLEDGRIYAVDILLSMGKLLSTFLVEQGYAEEETVNVVPTQQEIHDESLEYIRRHSDGKDNNSWAEPPEPQSQAVGDHFSVLVTHLQSPTEITLQKVENAGVIQELQLKLREHCSQIPAPKNFRPNPGTVCCAQFSEDKQWYRAKILAYSSEERVCVCYLDFGNSEEVDLGHLRPISSSLLALPMQAVLCGLAGVQPVGKSWSEDCLLALQRRVSNRILRIEIQGTHEGKALVVMIDDASDPQANVAELLTSAGFAAPAPITISGDPQADQTATAAAEKHETGLNIVSPSESLVWSCTELPNDGQTVALLASVTENPEEFYCRINNPADHQRLIELGAELKKHCEAKASPFVPKVGEPCCAMFPGDGAWYRAMVNGLSEDKVSVDFVDFGYSMKVEKNHLRSITPQLLSLPFQAIRCRLAGVEPLGSEWSSEAMLWFQTLVEGQQLSAHVLSVSEQGYEVELESRGQDVAAALILEQLAQSPAAIPKETHATTDSGARHQEKIKDDELSQIHAQASNQTKARSADTAVEEAGVPSEAPSFPVDWKTVELPLNETFKPYIAAIISPSLFYMLGPSQVDKQELQGLMMDLATYCSNNQATFSSSVPSRPAPGAACCVQYSGDNNWYRAVVVEVGENEISVIYADFGNTEKVPFSRVLPIPTHLLQLPFQITRCTLTGKDFFPAEWPAEVQQVFKSLLLDGVLATVQAFEDSANVVSLSRFREKGGGQLTGMIMDALTKAQAKSNTSPPTTQKTEQDDHSTPTASRTVVPDCPQPKMRPETVAPQPAPRTSAVSATVPQTSGCCCLSLKTKIDHLEQMLQLQLSLIEHLVGQTK